VFIPVVYEGSIALGRAFTASSFWFKEDFETLPTFLVVMMSCVNFAGLICSLLLRYLKIDEMDEGSKDFFLEGQRYSTGMNTATTGGTSMFRNAAERQNHEMKQIQ
jgi:hypothetical protein